MASYEKTAPSVSELTANSQHHVENGTIADETCTVFNF